MNRVFVLEDDINRINIIKKLWSKYAEFDIATSYKEAIKLFKNNYSLLMLDHDLGGKIFVSSKMENTGAGFLRWLIKQDFNGCDIIIHSHNPSGSQNMERILSENNFNKVIRLPFGTLIDGWDKGIIGFFNHYKHDGEINE
jgi:CheY-like chemotaxis protein